MNLIGTEGRIVCFIDIESKNWHKFSNGMKIRLERKYNNLNKRHTEPVNATVIEGMGLPEGAELLVHHNSIHPVNQIFNYEATSGKVEASSIKYFSVPESMCFFWRNPGDEWQPLPGYATALRVYEPIKTQFYGVAPQKIKNTLYITSGSLKGKVVHTVRAADYELIFQGDNDQESKVIRCRHYEEKNDREEIIAINHHLSCQVEIGECYVGLSETDAKPINQLVHA